jgi:Zn-finger protein
MEMEKLLPCMCPFCDGEAMQYSKPREGWSMIICKDCLGGFIYHNNRATQVKNWNTRKGGDSE